MTPENKHQELQTARKELEKYEELDDLINELWYNVLEQDEEDYKRVIECAEQMKNNAYYKVMRLENEIIGA